jgi:hypothetical protein
MRAAIEGIGRCQSVAREPAARRVRVLVLDESPQYLSVICSRDSGQVTAAKC